MLRPKNVVFMCCGGNEPGFGSDWTVEWDDGPASEQGNLGGNDE